MCHTRLHHLQMFVYYILQGFLFRILGIWRSVLGGYLLYVYCLYLLIFSLSIFSIIGCILFFFNKVALLKSKLWPHLLLPNTNVLKLEIAWSDGNLIFYFGNNHWDYNIKYNLYVKSHHKKVSILKVTSKQR